MERQGYMQRGVEPQANFTPNVIDAVCLMTVERCGINQRPDLVGRLLMTLARLDIPVLLMSQSSHEGNFCVVIPQEHAASALNALNAELCPGRDRQDAARLLVKTDLAILKGSTTYCEHLAAQGVNILVMAQGTGGYEASLVVESACVRQIRVS